MNNYNQIEVTVICTFVFVFGVSLPLNVAHRISLQRDTFLIYVKIIMAQCIMAMGKYL